MGSDDGTTVVCAMVWRCWDIRMIVFVALAMDVIVYSTVVMWRIGGSVQSWGGRKTTRRIEGI